MRSKRFFMAALLLFIAVFALSACAPQTNTPVTESDQASRGETGSHDDEAEDHADASDMAHAHVEPPDEFADLTNPFGNDPEAIAAGKETFNNLCVTCHGPEGRGDGPTAETLDPKPANLADPDMMGMLTDGYLFWRISKGGAMEPFNSAMIAWESSLTEDQRWELISYVRTLSGGDMNMDHAEEEAHSEE